MTLSELTALPQDGQAVPPTMLSDVNETNVTNKTVIAIVASTSKDDGDKLLHM